MGMAGEGTDWSSSSSMRDLHIMPKRNPRASCVLSDVDGHVTPSECSVAVISSANSAHSEYAVDPLRCKNPTMSRIMSDARGLGSLADHGITGRNIVGNDSGRYGIDMKLNHNPTESCGSSDAGGHSEDRNGATVRKRVENKFNNYGIHAMINKYPTESCGSSEAGGRATSSDHGAAHSPQGNGDNGPYALTAFRCKNSTHSCSSSDAGGFASVSEPCAEVSAVIQSNCSSKCGVEALMCDYPVASCASCDMGGHATPSNDGLSNNGAGRCQHRMYGADSIRSTNPTISCDSSDVGGLATPSDNAVPVGAVVNSGCSRPGHGGHGVRCNTPTLSPVLSNVDESSTPSTHVAAIAAIRDSASNEKNNTSASVPALSSSHKSAMPSSFDAAMRALVASSARPDLPWRLHGNCKTDPASATGASDSVTSSGCADFSSGDYNRGARPEKACGAHGKQLLNGNAASPSARTDFSTAFSALNNMAPCSAENSKFALASIDIGNLRKDEDALLPSASPADPTPHELHTLRQKASELGKRLQERERQCLALKNALEGCGLSVSAPAKAAVQGASSVVR